MARNRKRAKDRRTRRPAQPGSSRRGIATREGAPGLEPQENGALEPEAEHRALEPEAEHGALEPEENGAPDPIEHATPDVELADAQLAYGRPAEPELDDEADEEEFEAEVAESIAAGGGRGGGYDDEALDGGGAEAAVPEPVRAERRPGMLERLIGFLQGCWRELQRVQWPDRPQVIQATGVVIGFVIVAAAFLGLADFVSGKLVTFILK